MYYWDADVVQETLPLYRQWGTLILTSDTMILSFKGGKGVGIGGKRENNVLVCHATGKFVVKPLAEGRHVMYVM